MGRPMSDDRIEKKLDRLSNLLTRCLLADEQHARTFLGRDPTPNEEAQIAARTPWLTVALALLSICTILWRRLATLEKANRVHIRVEPAQAGPADIPGDLAARTPRFINTQTGKTTGNAP